MGDGGGVVAVSVAHEFVGGTPGSGIVSRDVLGMRGVCEMSMGLDRG